MALNEDKIIIDVEVQVDDSKLNSDLKSIKKEVDAINKSDDLDIKIKTTVDNVNSASSLKDLKTSLKELQGLAIQVGDSNQEALNKINIAAGQAKDKIGDLRDGFNSLSGSPIENVASSFSSLKQKTLALDLDGVKQQFGNLKLSLLGVAEQLGLVEIGANGVAISMRGILVASGIGALIIAVGVLAANWEEVTAAIEGTTKAQKQYNEVVQESLKNSADERVALQQLLVVQGDEKVSRENKLTLFHEQQKLYPATLGNYTDEEFLLGKVNSKIKDQISLIKERALVTVLEGKLVEATKELEEKSATKFILGIALTGADKQAYIKGAQDKVDFYAKALKEAYEKIDITPEVKPSDTKKAEKSGSKVAKDFKKGFDDELKETQPDEVLNFDPFENSGIKSKAFFEQQIKDLERARENVKLGGDEWIRYGDLIDGIKQKVKELESVETPTQKKKREDQEEYNTSLKETLSILDQIKKPIDPPEPEKESLADRFSLWQENNKEKLSTVAGYLSQLSDAVGQVGDVIQGIFEIRINKAENAADKEIAALQKTFDAATKGKNLSNAQQVALENKLAKDKYKIALDLFNKEEKLRERAFKANKAIQIVQALIGTAQGVVAALSEPFFPLMIARMALAATTGAVQIGVIASQKYQAGDAPTAPSPISVPEPSLPSPSQNTNVQGPDRSFQAAQFFGLGGKQSQDSQDTYQKVYVVESDITDVQRRVNVIESRAVIG